MEVIKMQTKLLIAAAVIILILLGTLQYQHGRIEILKAQNILQEANVATLQSSIDNQNAKLKELEVSEAKLINELAQISQDLTKSYAELEAQGISYNTAISSLEYCRAELTTIREASILFNDYIRKMK